jgi:hypothetical protein
MKRPSEALSNNRLQRTVRCVAGVDIPEIDPRPT